MNNTIKIHNLGEAWRQPAVNALLESPGLEQVPVEDAEVFVCWGLRPPHEELAKSLIMYSFPVIILDSGYLNRPAYGRDAEPTDYYSVNLGGILKPEPTAKVLNFLLPPKRAVQRREHAMDYLLVAPSKEGGIKTSVVLGQTVGDRSHGMDADALFARYASMDAPFFRPHPQDDVVAERLYGLPGLHVLDKGEPLLEALGKLGGPHNVVVKTICSNAGLEAKLAGYTVEADSAWYKDMGRWKAFFTACDGQFNCDELRELGYGLVAGLINLNK